MTSVTAPGTAAETFGALGLDKIGADKKTDSQTASAERFLKMLVAQMQNQDPLNPMDNAQVTSQMAQINTVSGLEQVNVSVRSLNSALFQMQALQGAALVGRDVTLAGDRLQVSEGAGRGGFDLAGKASDVRLEVLSPSGSVVGTMALGNLEGGRHFFEWPSGKATDGDGLRFRVVASNGKDPVATAPLARDRVTAVSADGEGLTVSLQRAGTVPSSRVLAFN